MQNGSKSRQIERFPRVKSLRIDREGEWSIKRWTGFPPLGKQPPGIFFFGSVAATGQILGRFRRPAGDLQEKFPNRQTGGLTGLLASVQSASSLTRSQSESLVRLRPSDNRVDQETNDYISIWGISTSHRPTGGSSL